MRADQKPANEGAVDNMAPFFVIPEEYTLAVGFLGLSFYQASFYYFMIEEEDLDL